MSGLMEWILPIVVKVGGQLGDRWLDRAVDGLDATAVSAVRQFVDGSAPKQTVVDELEHDPAGATKLADNVARLMTDPAVVAGIQLSWFPAPSTELEHYRTWCNALGLLSDEQRHAIVLEGFLTGTDYVSIWYWTRGGWSGADVLPVSNRGFDRTAILLGGARPDDRMPRLLLWALPVKADARQEIQQRVAAQARLGGRDPHQLTGRQPWLQASRITEQGIVWFSPDSLQPHVTDTAAWEAIRDDPDGAHYPEEIVEWMIVSGGAGIELMRRSLGELAGDALRRATELQQAIGSPDPSPDSPIDPEVQGG